MIAGLTCGQRRGDAKGLLPRSDSWVGPDYVQFYKDTGAPVRFDGGAASRN